VKSQWMIMSLLLLSVVSASVSASAAAEELPANSVTAEHAWRPPHRVWARLSGFADRGGFGYASASLPSMTGGLIGNAGAEMGLRNGLTLGFELAPFSWISSTTRPSLAARFAVGYAQRRMALALEAGSTLTWLYPQLGPSLRIGALEGTYATVHVAWALYPPQPVPTNLELEVSAPISPRLRGYANVGAVYGSSIGAWGTLGLHIMPAGSRALLGGAFTVGAGVSWMQWSLGPMFTVGYERRL
jgi:hypothetical protein